MGSGAGGLRPDVAGAARHLLGFASLHPAQEEAVQTLLAGSDALVVMPTGAGKSAVYQLAGHLIGGTTVVVSPLLALQRDQLGALEAAGLGPAAVLNSTLGAEEERRLLDDIGEGRLRFVLLGPEQLQRPEVQEALCRFPPRLVAVDEAHCVSSWGHDFRPDYTRLAGVISLWDHPPVAALTATAAPPVRRDIVDLLGLADPVVIVSGFDRPNLSLAVRRFQEAPERDDALAAAVTDTGGAGIVYAATRRRCEELAERLAAGGAAAEAYHAGLPTARRRHVEERFMSGAVRVVVATTAFGMGIDKPDVRFVYHAEPADSLDSYYQEIGRAGRDGEPASAVLFYRREDLGLRRFFASQAPPAPESVLAAGAMIARRSARGPVTVEEVAEALGTPPAQAHRVVAALERAEAVEVLPGGAVLARRGAENPVDLAEVAGAEGEAHETVQRSRVEMMRAYAEERDCRRDFILGYFGQATGSEGCGHCDNCAARAENPAGAETDGFRPTGAFPAGSAVVHSAWGDGEVLRRDGDEIYAVFERAGYRILSERLVREAGVLSEAPGKGCGP